MGDQRGHPSQRRVKPGVHTEFGVACLDGALDPVRLVLTATVRGHVAARPAESTRPSAGSGDASARMCRADEPDRQFRRRPVAAIRGPTVEVDAAFGHEFSPYVFPGDFRVCVVL